MPKTKVHPNAAGDPVTVVTTSGACTGSAAAAPDEEEPPAVLTVWRKSLLFNCDGFTVFDANGDLAFRVESYSYDAASRRRRRAEVVLMDATGNPLLTVRRRRRLGMLDEHWLIYDGDAAASAAAEEPGGSNNRPLFSVRRHARRLGAASTSPSSKKKKKAPPVAYVTPLPAAGPAPAAHAFVVEGSYGLRACAVRDARGDDDDAVLAEVRRKEAVLGDDVFRLVVDPRLGATLAMGLVIALDEMFAGGRRSRSLRRSRTWSSA